MEELSESYELPAEIENGVALENMQHYRPTTVKNLGATIVTNLAARSIIDTSYSTPALKNKKHRY